MAVRRSRWRARRAAGALAACCALAAGCGPGNALTAATLSPPAQGRGSLPGASPAGSGGDSPARAAAGACVARTDAKMTLARRVGQLFLVGVPDDVAGPQTRAAVLKYHFGAVLLPQDAYGTGSLAAATASIQALAPAAAGGVRFFVAANQEGGMVQQLTGAGFLPIPSALVQGAWPLTALRAQARAWGNDLHAAGVNLDLAPVMDVVPAATAADNAPIGALDREFGYGAGGDGQHGAAFIEGMRQAGVATVAKHFPGLGQVSANTDFAAGVVDGVTTAGDAALNSFRAAIGAGVPFVMVALATYTRIDPANRAVFSAVVMRLLRSGLGFGGVIASDDLGDAAAVASIPAGQRAIDFLTAGGDMITSQSIEPAAQMASAVIARASSDAAFRGVVESAAWRVLVAKQARGLLPC